MSWWVPAGFLALFLGAFLAWLGWRLGRYLKGRYRALFEAEAEGQRIAVAERAEMREQIAYLTHHVFQVLSHQQIEELDRKIRQGVEDRRLAEPVAARFRIHLERLRRENLEI
jgi:hypothetical protein